MQALAVAGMVAGAAGIGAGVVLALAAPGEPSNARPRVRARVGAALLGLGVAGATAGAVSAGLGLALESDLHERCPDGKCTVEQEGRVDNHAELGAIAAVSFGAGAAAAGAGLALLLTDRAPATTRSAAKMEPFATPTGLGLRGRFW